MPKLWGLRSWSIDVETSWRGGKQGEVFDGFHLPHDTKAKGVKSLGPLR